MTTAVAAKPKKHLINAQDAAIHLRRAFHINVPPATIRKWASRRKIGSYGLRRERYDLREVEDYAIELGKIANP